MVKKRTREERQNLIKVVLMFIFSAIVGSIVMIVMGSCIR